MSEFETRSYHWSAERGALDLPDGRCIFCEIVMGKREASVLYEDDVALAFMDLRQVSFGHSLVIPKRHVRDLYGLDDATGSAIMMVLRRVASATKVAFRAEGVSVWQSNDPPWQEVLHLHFHVMPRRLGDGVLRVYPQLPGHATRQALDEQAALIRDAIDGEA